MLSTRGGGNIKIVTCVVGRNRYLCCQPSQKIADSIESVQENVPFSDQLIFLIAAYSKVRMVHCIYWGGGGGGGGQSL